MSRWGRQRFVDWILPVALLVAATVPFWITDLDLRIQSRFYSPGTGWERGDDAPWSWLYRYGVVPAWVIALSALAVFFASFRSRWQRHRRAAMFLVLAMVIGPGVVVNDVFKEHWGRPRPKDVTAFGGDRAYVEPWVKSPRENGNSFVSGHAATAFYLMTPFFLLRRRARPWAAAVLLVGLGYGALMGLARMLQGAHFPSDVLWSLGFVYLTGVGLYYALRLDRARS